MIGGFLQAWGREPSEGHGFMSDYTKILLEEHEMPARWYNIVPDLPEPPPPPVRVEVDSGGVDLRLVSIYRIDVAVAAQMFVDCRSRPGSVSHGLYD